MKNMSLLGIALLTFSVSPMAATSDIGGVSVGLPFASQRQLLEKVNPNYQIDEVKSQSGQVMGLNATQKKENKLIDQFVILQNKQGNVWFASRVQNLEVGSRILHDTLLSSLKEKYGQYTEQTIGNSGAAWDFDRSGNLYKGPRTQGPCMPRGLSTNLNDSIGQVKIPRSFLATCGKKIEASSLSGNDGMVSSFTVRVIDEKSMYDEVNNQQKTIEEQKKEAIKSEQSKNNLPKL